MHSFWNLRRLRGCIAVNFLRASDLHRARFSRGSSFWTSQPLLTFSRSRMRWRMTSSAWLGLLDGSSLNGFARPGWLACPDWAGGLTGACWLGFAGWLGLACWAATGAVARAT